VAQRAAARRDGPIHCAILRAMIDRTADPRTEDVIVFDLLRTEQGAEARVVGTATFRNGTATVEAPDAIRVAVEELLSRAFVDRVQADERPRGYRRSGRGIVDMLVPGMAEHFIARLRGLWLSYPDGSVATARQRTGASAALTVADAPDAAPPVTDAATRRSTLAGADRAVNKSPLVRSHAPETGIRPAQALAHRGTGPVGRSDCGWLV
jgi:pyruvate/2-oxoglutarate dehydrogenase complex dihydrolipoamide acyltransferase (E2) component